MMTLHAPVCTLLNVFFQHGPLYIFCRSPLSLGSNSVFDNAKFAPLAGNRLTVSLLLQ